jgi:Tol biopolymer transport system component
MRCSDADGSAGRDAATRQAWGAAVTLRLLSALFGLVGLAVVFTASGSAARPQVRPRPFRIMFTSDWTGSYEIYAADPSGARPTAQLTFGRAPTCAETGCGYADLGLSPDGRFVLYSDFSRCSPSTSRTALFVARADGSHARLLAHSTATANCPGAIDASWAPDSRRVAYAVDGRIAIADVDGRDRHVIGRGDRVSWSPAGTSIAFSAVGDGGYGYGPLSVWTNGRKHVLTAAASDFRWSPHGRWIAYTITNTSRRETVIARPDGSGRRVVADAVLQWAGWSADGRFLTVWSGSGVAAVRVADGSVHPLGFASALAWHPRGHVLAVTDERGTSVLDVATGASRLLTSEQAAAGAWSPDGRSFAYVWQSSPTYFGYGDLRVVTLAGVTRTLVRGGGAFGGYVGGLVWTRAPNGAHYRRARPRVLAAVSDDGLTAPWPITRLAADGSRVAYISCGHVFVWTPSDRSVIQAEPSSSMSPRCTTPGNYLAFSLYSLALSGDRIAYGYRDGNLGQEWGLYAGSIDDGTSFASLGSVVSVNGCAVGAGGLGDLAGGGGLLVFSTWRDDLGCPARTLEQEIHRVDALSCPCSAIASSPGPLVPFDVDADRVVAGGGQATVVDDASGTQLLSVPVSALAAQLAGSDLVVLVRGQLLVYDAATGVQLHAWPLPDVPSGGECASPHYGTWECTNARLILEDAARGLAAYVLDGQVHVLRLADGVDRTVATGTLARFLDTGLVYADGSTLHFVPYEQLLHA